MKELSIEEKAKRYDKVIEELRGLLEGIHEEKCEIMEEDITNIFSELCESEDERIRKEIIEYIKNEKSAFPNERKDYERWIAWLEKQGESYTKREVDDAYLKGVTNTKNEIEKQYEANYQIRKDIATFIFNYKGVIKDRAKWMDYLGIKVSFVEKQGEKPVDKVEPKFKVGDWVVTDKNNVVQIKAIEDSKYVLENTMRFSVDYVDKCWRKWTIHDAKDGDVLHSIGFHSDCIFIFNGLDNWKYDEPAGDRAVATGYCCLIVSADSMEFGIQGPDCIEVNTVKPATKKERDLLFQKMKEAGYEWDAEKKELKKIVAPKFNVHDCIIKKHNSNINDFGSFVITDITGGKYWYNDRIICDISEQDEWELYEPVRQEPAEWTEDDERMYRGLHNLIYSTPYCDSRKKFSDFLNSLKDRVQPNKEWSEEDEERIKNILSVLGVQMCWNGATGKQGNPYQKEINWLKSLKDRVQPQPQQEWGEEDMRNIQDIDSVLFYDKNLPEDTCMRLRNWLKFLRPQSQWTPSDGQMKALKEACDEHWEPDGLDPLYTLYQDLNKLRDE